MRVVETITIAELSSMAENMYGNLVKAVVDLQQNNLVVDAEMHADEEEFVEFDSMINIRPRQQNMSRNVEDKEIREQIIS